MASGCSTSTDDRQHVGLKSYADLLGQCNLSSSSSDGASSSSGSSSNDDSSSQDSDSETLDVVGKDGDTQTSLVTTSLLGSGDGADEEVPAVRSNDNYCSESDDSENETCAHVIRPAVRVPQVTLANKGEFSPNMRVQISPQGRLMQPVPTVRFSNLLDDLQYAVWISFVQECGQIAGNYMHPDAPLPGSRWNQRLVTFSRLRLFTFDGFNKTPVSLVCNKKYFLQINFGIVNDAGHILASTVIRQGIIGTWFVAVNYVKTSTSSSSSSKKH
ncbi:unnamed protein product, partial [Ixodes hexagonus]